MTWEEYKNQQLEVNKYMNHAMYTQTDIECPECGAFIYKNTTFTLASYPPQQLFRCMECGWSGTN